MKELTITENESGKRLDRFLQQYLSGASAGFLYKMLRKKNITLNGGKSDGSEHLAVGDVVRIYFSDETFCKFANTDTKIALSTDTAVLEERRSYFTNAYQKLENTAHIEVVYEDDDLLILNKPAGILSQKSSPTSISLNEWGIGYLLIQDKITTGQLSTYRPSIVNRLDRNTSGLLLYACNLKTARLLSKAVREHEIRKFYHCVVYGKYNAGAELRGYALKNNDNFVNVFDAPESSPKDARMMESRVKILEYNSALNVSFLEIELVTGVTHQIRASLHAAGFPIVGDPKYNRLKNSKQLNEKFHIAYQLLHSQRLVFPAFDDGLLPNVSGRYFTCEDPLVFDILRGFHDDFA